ncbi:DedA family protein [Aquiluna sp.]|nr:DedA family protein [Aquiluna sp.]
MERKPPIKRARINYVLSPAIRLSVTDDIVSWFDVIGPYLFYGAVFGLVFAGTGLFIGAFIPFITGDSLVFAAGLVAAANADSINIAVMVLGVGIAAWLGDQVGYTLGRHYGRPYLDKRKGSWLQKAIARSEQFYQRYGWWSIVVARFVPWGRVIIPALAGISKMNYYKFFSANAVGATLWGCGLTLAGYFTYTIPAVKSAVYVIAIVVILLSVIAGIRTWRSNRV